jgi:hypothetical protein
MISIICNDSAIDDCVAVLLVPEIAVQEPGYITALSSSGAVASKHEFQALAQTAYYQYQDDEIGITLLEGPCRISAGDSDEMFERGLLIYRSSSGTIHIAAHRDAVDSKKLLEAANRYCTRWVRLDI